MMTSPFFSVIVPVYNVQEYIGKCLQSVVKQSFTDFEIIVVNDGTLDSSLEICEEFQAKDSRVRVFSKLNGGSSSARNYGFNVATGEYIIYLDSDDYWDDIEALSRIHYKVSKRKNDVLLYGCKDLDVRNNILQISKGGYDTDFIDSHEKKKVLDYLVDNGKFPGAAWLVAVRKKILTEHEIRFNEDNNAEDIDWLLNVFFHAETITALDEPFYVYLKNRNSSITSFFGRKSMLGILYAIEQWKEVLKKDKINNSLLKILSYNYILAVAQFRNNPELRMYKPQLAKNTDLLNKALAVNTKTLIAMKILSLLGINFGSAILKLIFKYRK